MPDAEQIDHNFCTRMLPSLDGGQFYSLHRAPLVARESQPVPSKGCKSINVTAAFVENDSVILYDVVKCLTRGLTGFPFSRIVITSRRSSA
jgi:hypothetical protein